MKKGIALVHPYLPSLVGTIVWENNVLSNETSAEGYETDVRNFG